MKILTDHTSSTPRRFKLGSESGLKSGFALIATISVMVLLVMIALAMLSLSTIELRASRNDQAMAEARANARMALMLAIGELQKHAGPDTRVSAPSNIADENSPPLLGVWKSWEGTDHESTGRPVEPDYGSKKRSETDGGRFLAWLVSGAAGGGDPTNPSALASSSPAKDTVPLLYDGTLGAGKDGAVHVVPHTRDDKSGSFAWWVSGENLKARLPKHYKPENENDTASWSELVKSHSVADPKPFGLEQDLLVVPSPADKAITLGTANFVAPNAAIPPRGHFHDLSVSSVGLLTNTATGGWRKDMSLVTENWDALPATDLPFFRLDANYTTTVSKPTKANPRAMQSILYPWSDYQASIKDTPLAQIGAVTSWRSLVEYATAYKRITPSGGGSGSIPYSRTQFFPITPDSVHDYLHTIRTSPSVVRVHWVFSHRTILDKGILVTDVDDTYRLQLLITPVITMWNPYNVSVAVPLSGIKIKLVKSPPCALLYYNREGLITVPGRKLIKGSIYPAPDSLVANYPDVFFDFDALEYNIKGDFTLLPGETRVFSAASAVTTPAVNMTPGYNPIGGHTRNIDFIGDAHKKGDKIKLDIKFDNLINLGVPGCGIWLEIDDLSYTNYERYMLAVTPVTALRYWPEKKAVDLPTPEAQEIEGTTWHPFFSTVFGARVASDTNLAAKGLLQASPLVSYTNMVFNGFNLNANNPANGAFDYSFLAHRLGGDDKTPNANARNKRGYIISGYQQGTGLSRAIINDFPLRPMASIAELQNWNLRAYNPYPPFQLNIIGNSDASPLVAPHLAHISNVIPNAGAIMQHDDPYCANHLLFDDWFFSSISPEPVNFGSAIAADLRTHYTKFLKGERPLSNRAYRRIAEDLSLSDKKITERVNDALSPDGWQRVASRFEVDGMFNVNSTSVKAWRALLGHARNQKIPHHTEGGMALSPKTDHAYSRFSVAGDTKAGDLGMSGRFPESSEITGYRVFDDALLDILAEKIVEQVRLRGPFLSLSEFMNRQLSKDKDLALAGAIQTALNRMSEQAGDDDPLKILKSPALSQDAGDPADPKLAGAGYLFPEAAVGKSTYGLPGWTRQADVLRPLAPILSARDDTFTIRAYGDFRDKAGNVLAKAWCEATVRRRRDFVDPIDPADSVDAPSSNTNVRFGRSFAILSFRWLSPNEV